MRAKSQLSSQPNLWKGCLAGAFGGLIASFAMGKFYSLLPGAENYSQPGKEDSTVKVASAILKTVFHYDLAPDQKNIAGAVVHYTFGTTMAALYGVLVEFRGSEHLGGGLPFGFAVWLGAHMIFVPIFCLSEAITRVAPKAEAAEFASHLVYGSVAEGLRRLFRKYPLR
jgi:putative membrane protein